MLACAFVILAHTQRWFEDLDRLLYDLQIAAIEAPRHADIVVVAIDDASLYAYGPWPWPRDVQAALLEAINALAPQAVALDIIYAGETTHDATFISTAAATSHLALPMMVDTLGQGRQHIEVLPIPGLIETAENLGHVHVELDEDAIARGTYLFQGVGTPRWPHLMVELSALLTERVTDQCGELKAATLNIVKCGYVRLPFAGPPGTYPQVSALTLLDGDGDPELLRNALADKIVLVGLTATGSGDWVTSPTSGEVGPMSGVEFNANLLSALATDSLIREAPDVLSLIFALSIVILCTLLLPRLKPKQMLIVTLSLALAPLALSSVSLGLFWHHMSLAHATIAVVLLYPLWSWRRHEIAWTFIQTELERIDLESRDWNKQMQALPARRGTLIEQLDKLLDGTVRLVGEASDIQLQCERKLPLTGAEAALLRDASEQFYAARGTIPGPPGEILAAQIRRLELAAREVREGRAMGLSGLSHMSNGALIISAFGDIRFANAAGAALLNLSQQPTNAAFETLEAIQPPLGETWPDIARRAVFANEPTYFEGVSPAQQPIFVSVEPLLQEGAAYATLWIVTLADLSAIREAQAQREEALAFLSHDIRSPLLSVLALLRSADTDTQLLQEISRYTQKSLSTSEQFLQLSRLQMQSDFEKYDTELEQVLRNAVEQVFFLAKDKGIRCQVETKLAGEHEEDGVWVNGNGELLERAFINLLTNAIKYSERGTSVTLRLSVDDNMAEVVVADEGYGIPADELEHIFAPFFRSSAPKLAEHRGAGLGLRFVKTVFDRHNGSIDVASVWEKGTTFTVRLPICPPEA